MIHLSTKTKPKELKGLKPNIINKADDFVYSKAEFYIKGEDLFVKMGGTYLKAIWFKIENFKKCTALEIINKVKYGRHFEDGILKIWQDRGLDFGWKRMVIKELIE